MESLVSPIVRVLALSQDPNDDLMIAVWEHYMGPFSPLDDVARAQASLKREVEQGKNLVDAMKRAGIKHFVWRYASSDILFWRSLIPSQHTLAQRGHRVPDASL